MKKVLAELKNYIKKSKGIVTACGIGLATVILLCSFLVYTTSYAKILPNIKVEGIKIGGMTADEAENELKTIFGTNVEDRTIVIECEENKKEVRLRDFSLTIDNKKTVEKAFEIGRDGGKFKKTSKILQLLFKGEEIPLECSVDEQYLDSVISEIAKDKEVEALKTGYIIDTDKLTIVRGHGGRMVDRKKAAAELLKAALDSAVNKIDFAIETIEEEKPDLEKLYAEITAPMKDAEYRLEDGEVLITPEKLGITLEKSALKEALESNQPEVILEVKTEEPEWTQAKLEELLFRDTMGTWTSDFSTSSSARAGNVILTANRINGKILMPGDVFSYDQTIGRRTYENGYREAGVYIGNKVESGIGGGICQTSSTLYSAALYANLEIVSRTSHSLPVSYMPAGQDATIAEGYIDLKIKNNTEYPIKISAQVSGRRLTCSILGVKDPETKVEIVHTTTATYEPETERTEDAGIPKGYIYITNKGAGGYAIASSRIVRKAGEVVKTEKLTRSVYRAAPREETVNPLDKETPAEQLKPYTPGMVIPEESDKPQEESEKPEEVTETLPEEQEEIPSEEFVEEEVNV
ncbi:MAG: VanW family protein [Clostridia bacterium]|nr:VanW family protein [Clostridia bacterium]